MRVIPRANVIKLFTSTNYKYL